MAGDGEAPEVGGGDGRRQRAAESLGWLTESAVMPKKHKAIEGVGAASMMELRAQYYKTQQETRQTRVLGEPDTLRAKKRPIRSDLFSNKNVGVDARNIKDKLELKAINDGSNSYAALEKKAELYEKLRRGELSDEDEKYSVDFFIKRQIQEEPAQSESCVVFNDVQQGNEDVDGGLGAKPFVPGRVGATVDYEEHKRFVSEVHEEANQARERAKTFRMRQQEEAAARREKLKQAYLRKKLEKMTAANVNNSS